MEEFKILSEIIKDIYGIDKESLIAKCRKRDLVELRYVCANVLRQETNYTVEYIGSELHIDHSTVCYAIGEHGNLVQSKNSRTYSDKFEKVSEAYFKKIQTPERLESQLIKLKDKKGEIESQIKNIEAILKIKRTESSKVEPIFTS
jgi:hypothetical protein